MRNREDDSVRLKTWLFPTSRQHRWRQFYVACLYLSLLLLPVFPLSAQTSEHEVKAAFLYKFAGYVQWPAHRFPDEASPLVFGVMGADPLADTLEQVVSGRKVNDRPVEVRRLYPGSSVRDVHVLFVGQSATPVLESLLEDLAVSSILTVTETAERPSGSVINFEIINDKVRFDVSLDVAEEGGLDISARLLQVAYRVIGGQI